MNKPDFQPSDGCYRAHKYPAMFELMIPYQVYSDKQLYVNIQDVKRSFDYHFEDKSDEALQHFTEELMSLITPEQVEVALKKIAHK